MRDTSQAPVVTQAERRALEPGGDELARVIARRDRLATLVRHVRDPRHHGALRKAILRLDARIAALTSAAAGE